MVQTDYDWQGMIPVLIAIGILAILLIPRLARMERGHFLARVLVWGLLLKVGVAIVRIWLDFDLYGGTADASRYTREGAIIAQHIVRLEFDQVAPFLRWGTDFISFFTGVIYSVLGPTRIGGYLVYAFLAFLGSCFFYSAFRVALPQGNRRLYAILVFFSPSLLLWSNGISKDALISLCIGLFAYGGARLTRNQLQGLTPLALGLLGALWIRPHIAAILALALFLAFLVRGVGKEATRPITFVIGLLGAGCLAWLLLPRVTAFLGMQELSPEEIFGFLQARQSMTFTGGSAFQAIDISNPLNLPMAMMTVLFRPFPWEAGNLQALAQSLEGLLFVGLILWRIKSVGNAVVSSMSNTYLRYILIFIIAFVVAFSVIGNFGILVRERTMMLPFFLMLIAYAPRHAGIKAGAQEVAV